MGIGFAFTAIVNSDGYSIGMAHEGVQGYTPMPEFGTFDTWDKAETFAREQNEGMELTPREAIRIVLTSMGPLS